jgi:hypothetical protein
MKYHCWMRRSRVLVGSVVPYANGSRMPQVFGIAVIVDIPSTSLTVVACTGIPLTLAGCVQGVGISGAGHHVCVARVGRSTKIGMRRSDVSL